MSIGPVLDVRNLTVAYATANGLLPTVRDVSLQIAGGEIYGLVGESGSGKTTLARALVRYLPENGQITAGAIMLDGTDLLALSRADMRRVWGARITMVHQDPAAAVNPALTVGEQIAEIARAHLGMSVGEARAKALEMLARVRMPDPESVTRRYAHQLSGGMLQRVLIAGALTTNPRLLIMDEPTTALDVTIQAVILDLLNDLRRETGTSVIIITHDLGVVAETADKVAVVYAGLVVESASVYDIYRQPRHPYTQALLASVPSLTYQPERLSTITGAPPDLTQPVTACPFAPRCQYRFEKCDEMPPLVEVEPAHRVACWLHV